MRDVNRVRRVHVRKGQKGLMPQDITAASSPLSRLILNAMNTATSLKVQIFLSFLGLETLNLANKRNAWAFFVRLLSCLTDLLGDQAQQIVRRWSSMEGTDIPLQCAMDILANLYNTDEPTCPSVSHLLLFLISVFRSPCCRNTSQDAVEEYAYV